MTDKQFKALSILHEDFHGAFIRLPEDIRMQFFAERIKRLSAK